MANKEHPTIFSSDMVIRILTCARCGKISANFPCCHCGSTEFCKTQTRRVPVERYRKWKVGDRIWVRETWRQGKPMLNGPDISGEVAYKADYVGTSLFNKKIWKPSIFMFRWAARIWLEITGLRVERAQDISEEDAIAEGLYPEGTDLDNGTSADNPYEQFAQLWDSINSKRGYGWDKNPEVKIIKFKRTK